jgi:hypothetical protein
MFSNTKMPQLDHICCCYGCCWHDTRSRWPVCLEVWQGRGSRGNGAVAVTRVCCCLLPLVQEGLVLHDGQQQQQQQQPITPPAPAPPAAGTFPHFHSDQQVQQLGGCFTVGSSGLSTAAHHR